MSQKPLYKKCEKEEVSKTKVWYISIGNSNNNKFMGIFNYRVVGEIILFSCSKKYIIWNPILGALLF